MSRDPWVELLRLHSANGYGVIRGITFDFRHPDTDGWRPAVSLGKARCSFEGPFGWTPRIVFPWVAGRAGLKRLGERADLTGRQLLRHIVKHGPDGFVDVGDKLFIRAVRRSSQGQPFGRDADTSSLHVRYSIQRADGRIDLLRGKSLYLHRDRDWTALTSGKLRVYWGGNLSLTVLERRLGYILSPGDIDELFRPTAKCEMNAARCVEFAKPFVVIAFPSKTRAKGPSRA